MWVHVFRVKGLHTGAWSFTGTWGGKEGWSKASVLGFQFFVFGSYLTPTLFYSLLHLCFLIFFPQDLVWPRKLLKTSQMSPAKWGSQSP